MNTLKRFLIGHFAITRLLVAFALICVTYSSYAQQRTSWSLQNVSGTVYFDDSRAVGPFSITSIIYGQVSGAPGTCQGFGFQLVCKNSSGVSSNVRIMINGNIHIGQTLPCGWCSDNSLSGEVGGSFSCVDKHDGLGGVSCTCTDNQTGTTVASFSYQRYNMQIKLAKESAADTAMIGFDPAQSFRGAKFGYHFYLNGHTNDSIEAVCRNLDFYMKYVVRDSKGKTNDSVFADANNTQGYFYNLGDSMYYPEVFDSSWAEWGSYVARFTIAEDTMLCVPDTGITFHYIINQGIYRSNCNGLPWIAFDAMYPDGPVPDSTAYANGSWFNKVLNGTGTGWHDVGLPNTIEATGTIWINPPYPIYFRGTMQLDTDKNYQKIVFDRGGELYVLTSLPLKSYTAGYVVDSVGEYQPQWTYSCAGLVIGLQNLLSNDSLPYSSPLAGFGFKFDSISFANISGTPTIILGATISIPGSKRLIETGGKCSSEIPPPPTKTAISIAPLQIPLDGLAGSGISGSVHISNLAVFPGFCVNDGFVYYYSQPDSLGGGFTITTPGFLKFEDKGNKFTIALSGGLVEGHFNQASINLQLSSGGIPLANTGLFLNGIRGGISGIYKPPLIFTFGGTLADATGNLLQLKGDFTYKEGTTPSPTSISGSFELDAFNFGTWQVVGTETITGNWNESLKLDGTVSAGSLGGPSYFMNGEVHGALTWNPGPLSITGTLAGTYQIPKLGGSVAKALGAITDYINWWLPITLQQASAGLKNKKITVNVRIAGLGAHATVDLKAPFPSSGFLTFGGGTVPINSAHHSKADQIQSLAMDTIHIPQSTSIAVIRIRGNQLPSASTLIDPTGKVYSASTADTAINLLPEPSENTTFWALRNPIPGAWVLSMPQRTATDTVDAEAQYAEEPITVVATQTGKHVTLNWNPLSTKRPAEITAYLDDSASGYHGFLAAIGTDANGTLSFDLTDSLSSCSYHVYVWRDDSTSITSAYASMELDNSKKFQAPQAVVAHLLGGDTVLLSWTPVATPGIDGYAIKVTDAAGKDSIYGSYFADQDSAVIIMPNHQSKRISLISFGDGIQSCWSPSVAATSSVQTRDDALDMPILDLQVWPNPTTSKSELRFTLSERNMIRVTIFDVLGNEIITPVQGVFDEGEHTIGFDLSLVPTGTYYCRAEFMGSVQTQKLIIER